MDASTGTDAETRSDAELVADLRAGSSAAMAALYDRYAAMVYRVALSLNPDRGAAEDVIQETLLALWNRAELFDPARGSLGGWLAAIARNRAIDRFRASDRHDKAIPFASIRPPDDEEGAFAEWLVAAGTVVAAGAPEASPDSALVEKDRHERITSALDELTHLERLTIVLAYRDGLSQSEIADRLGWPLGTVKTRSRRALRRLREAIESVDDAEAPSAAAMVAVSAGPSPARCPAVPC